MGIVSNFGIDENKGRLTVKRHPLRAKCAAERNCDQRTVDGVSGLGSGDYYSPRMSGASLSRAVFGHPNIARTLARIQYDPVLSQGHATTDEGHILECLPGSVEMLHRNRLPHGMLGSRVQGLGPETGVAVPIRIEVEQPPVRRPVRLVISEASVRYRYPLIFPLYGAVVRRDKDPKHGSTT